MKAIRFWVVAVLLLAGMGRAQDLEDTVTFGDSLTGNDILWRVYDNPADLYGADPMEAVFNKAALRGDRLWNYAVPGTEASGLLAEIVLYGKRWKAGRQDMGTFFSVETGGNDFLGNIDQFAAAPPGSDPSADARVDRLILNVRRTVALLRRASPGARLILWTVADVTVTPKIASRQFSSTALANIRAHLERANSSIRSLAGQGVLVFDLYVVTGEVLADPPILDGRPLRPPPAVGEYDCWFADSVHPTAAANAVLANAIIDRLNGEWNAGFPRYSEAEIAALARLL